jgi:hypothetical protein
MEAKKEELKSLKSQVYGWITCTYLPIAIFLK